MTLNLNRRGMMAGAAALAPTLAYAADKPALGTSPSVISQPPRDFGPHAAPLINPDPDVLILDKSFGQLVIGQEMIHRIHTGLEWAEGPAWCAAGQYALFSDVKGDKQYRYIWETRQMTVFRSPSYNSNGNTFDFEGRQVSCQDFLRRVVRWEHDGSLKVLADNYNGQPLNSPNDLAPHPDGSIWFTDPPFGIAGWYEGHAAPQELPACVYRVDPDSLEIAMVADDAVGPNGLAFSPDESLLYVVESRAAPRRIRVYQVDERNQLHSGSTLIDCGPGTADGFRVDAAGNLWCGWGMGSAGLDGVRVFAPDGTALGHIDLPERCANLCFGGLHGNRLFMASSRSLYSLYVNTQGAAWGRGRQR